MKRMTTEQEILLVEQIQAGDKDAFRLFINQYQKLVFHIVYKTCPDNKDLEDLCQDIFVKIYRNLNGFRNDCKMSTWIAKIAYNTCLNYLKKKKVDLYDDISPDYVHLDDLSGYTPLPDQNLEQQDVSEHLAKAISRLPGHYQTILQLYHVDEMQYGEISNIMDLPVGTVKSYLFRARNLLKKELLKVYHKEEIWQ